MWRHVGAHVEALEGKVDAGFQFGGGGGDADGLAEAFQVDDENVRDGPDAEPLDDLSFLVALRAEVGVLLAQLLLACVHAEIGKNYELLLYFIYITRKYMPTIFVDTMEKYRVS